MNDNQRKSWLSWLKPGDFLIAGIIAIVAVALLVLPNFSRQPAGFAVLNKDGAIIRQWTASEMVAAGQESLTANGYSYKIAWEAGKIRFLEATCLDQICVNTGWISRDGQIAACAPGHLILKVSGSGAQTSESSVDVIIK